MARQSGRPAGSLSVEGITVAPILHSSAATSVFPSLPVYRSEIRKMHSNQKETHQQNHTNNSGKVNKDLHCCCPSDTTHSKFQRVLAVGLLPLEVGLSDRTRFAILRSGGIQYVHLRLFSTMFRPRLLT